MPLGNDWALRLFGFAMTDDSYFRNPNSPRLNGGVNNNDPDAGKTEKYGVRATLAGNLSEQLSVYATVRYNELDGPNNIWIRETSTDLTHSNIVDTSFNPRHERETIAGSLELTYDFDGFAVISATSYTDTDSVRQTDLDVSQEHVLDLHRPVASRGMDPGIAYYFDERQSPCNGRWGATTWTTGGITRRTC